MRKKVKEFMEYATAQQLSTAVEQRDDLTDDEAQDLIPQNLPLKTSPQKN